MSERRVLDRRAVGGSEGWADGQRDGRIKVTTDFCQPSGVNIWVGATMMGEILERGEDT